MSHGSILRNFNIDDDELTRSMVRASVKIFEEDCVVLEAQQRAITENPTFKTINDSPANRLLGRSGTGYPCTRSRPRTAAVRRVIVLDTDVLSETLRPAPADSVSRWMKAQPSTSLFATSRERT